MTDTMPNIYLYSSPFIIQDDWIIKIENHNKNCTHYEIDTLNAKGILGAIDFKILEILIKYKYLNTYNLNLALDLSLPTHYKKKSYVRTFKKLVKAGILIKYGFYASDGSTLATPLRFYGLSPGAHSYIAPIVKNIFSISSYFPKWKILELLAINQLLIHSELGSKKITLLSQYTTKRIGSQHATVDCLLKYFSNSSTSPSFFIFLFCCRSCKDSRSAFKNRILQFFKWFQQDHSKYSCYMILILCETLSEVSTIHEIIMEFENIPKYPLYYITDAQALAGPFYENLCQCMTDEISGKIIINHLQLTL